MIKKVQGYQRPELDELLKKAISRREERINAMLEKEMRLKKAQQDQSMDEIKKNLSRFLTFPIVIGVFAAILMWHYYGWESLFNTLLSWTIGITIVATVVAIMDKYKLIHF